MIYQVLTNVLPNTTYTLSTTVGVQSVEAQYGVKDQDSNWQTVSTNPTTTLTLRFTQIKREWQPSLQETVAALYAQTISGCVLIMQTGKPLLRILPINKGMN